MKAIILLMLPLLLAACSPAAAPVDDIATVSPTVANPVTPTVMPILETATHPSPVAAKESPALATPATSAAAAATEPTAAAEPTATPAATASAFADGGQPSAVVKFGRTDEGAYFHGAADAPVTLIDYSDFL